MKVVNIIVNEESFIALCKGIDPIQVYNEIEDHKFTYSTSDSELDSDVKICSLHFRSLCKGDVISVIKPSKGMLYQFALNDIGEFRVATILKVHL